MKFSQMTDCRDWLEKQGVYAEIGIDYIYIIFEKSKNVRFQSYKEIPFHFLSELRDNLNCSFSITSFIPDENDDSFPWTCRAKKVSDEGLLLILDFRLFGDSGGPVFTGEREDYENASLSNL